jgi:hypothetical protein
MNTQENISVKAKFGTEIRRFALPTASSFSTLEQTLGNVFSINNKLTIKYLDDEGDLCTISTQEEFAYAATLQSLLHIQIFLSDPQIVPQIPQITEVVVQTVPQIPQTTEVAVQTVPQAQIPQPVVVPQEEMPEAPKAQKFDKMQARRNQLELKRNSILAQLTDESLRPDKKEFLTKKAQQIETRLQFLDSRLRDDTKPSDGKREKGFPKHGRADQPGPWGRGKRGGRGCNGRGRGDRHQEDPVLFSLTEEARPRILEAKRNGDEAAVVAIQMEVMNKFQNHLVSKSESL